MSKKAKIFANIIYYVFTIGLGILLAIVLPGLLMTSNLPVHIENYLAEGEYEKSVNLLIDYDYTDAVFQKDFDNGSGICLFAAMVTEDNTDEDKIQDTRVCKAYSGFLYNAKDYLTSKLLNNKTKLILNKGTDSEYKITLLNQDTDDDGLYDDVMTKVECTYVYFDILLEDVTSVSSLTFIDADGNEFVSCNVSLDFSEVFFDDIDAFLKEYNKDSSSDTLQTLEDEILAKSDKYSKGSYQNEKKLANREGSIYVLIYFIAIYVLADFTVGAHFILHGIEWLIRKIRKKEPKKPVIQESVYGTDYFTSVTMRLVVPEDCDINITVSYHNENNEIEMVFSKDQKYTVTQRIHAGSYPNAVLTAPGYISENLPDILEVQGFSMDIEVTLRKAEDDSEKIKKE